MQVSTLPASSRSLARYFSEINRFSVLTLEQEQILVGQCQTKKNLKIEHMLVTSNLRFVVKIAFEYRSYSIQMIDIIQEGNIGLMKAVQKFDPAKGVRFVSYAEWWIRAYIQNYILKSWSLVKIGTTQTQRKLFFCLARTKREIENVNDVDVHENAASSRQIAQKLRVKPIEVAEMEQRIEKRDFSLDTPKGEDGNASHIDFVDSEMQGQEEYIGKKEESRLMASHVEAALSRLDWRERFIIEKRVMSDEPMSFNELIQHFGISRERVRQLEVRAKQKLRQNLKFIQNRIHQA